MILFIFKRDDFDLQEVEVTEDKTFRGEALKPFSPRGWLHTPLNPGGVVFSPAGTWEIAYCIDPETLLREIKERVEFEHKQTVAREKELRMWLAGFKAVHS